MRNTLVVLVLLSIYGADFTNAENWPGRRGADRTDMSHQTGLLEQRPTGGPKRVWLSQDAGVGYSGFEIAALRPTSALADKSDPPAAVDKPESAKSYLGHTALIKVIRFSADGKEIFSGSEDATIRRWNVVSGMEFGKYEGHKIDIRDLAISPDGRKIASASSDKTARIWDVETGETLQVLKGHTSSIQSVAFSTDGAKVATASKDVRIWDVKTGRELRRFRGDPYIFWTVGFLSDNRLFASGERMTFVWDLKVGATLRRLGNPSETHFGAAAAPNSSYIVYGRYNGQVGMWRLDSKEVHSLGHHRGIVARPPTISADGRFILTAGRQDRTLRLWDAKHGRLVRQISVLTAMAASISPDGKWVIVGGHREEGVPGTDFALRRYRIRD